MISLSEPQLFQCDASQVLQLLDSEYNYFLNSDDLHDPELPTIRNRSFGGTLLLWDKTLDPFIKVLKPSSPAFLVAVLKIPSLKTSLHVTVYLPTSGKDYEFVSEFADLRNCLDEMVELYSDPVIYIRGDGNVNPNNSSRVVLLKQLLHDYSLVSVDTQHPTYHHFTGSGLYDSKIDLVLHSNKEAVTENITEIICKHENPTILSHHDIILSEFTIPVDNQPEVNQNLKIAPRVEHTRMMVQWTPEGQAEFESLVGPLLRQARQDWLDPSSQACMSILLQLTNDILNMTAKATNKTSVLGAKIQQKARATPRPVKKAINRLTRAHNRFNTLTKITVPKKNLAK